MTSPRAVLHVGLPKTGTSFVQGVLRGNLDVLGRHGVRMPAGTDTYPCQDLFLSVLYLTERSRAWGRSAEAGRRAWGRISVDIRKHQAVSVVSSETLCLATDEQIQRILDRPGRRPSRRGRDRA